MKHALVSYALVCAAASLLVESIQAEDEAAPTGLPVMQASTGVVPAPAASMPAPGRPRGMAPGKAEGAPPSARAAAQPMAATGSDPVSFVSEEKWGMAGYNSDEPIYTILITSHDPRIIRCTADLKGTYIENGAKLPVTDRQTITVFPNAQVQIGNWSGMDQASGAAYSVKCRAI